MENLAMEDSSKQCLECNESFFGRADKKFCSDQCRVAFNNRLNANANNFVKNVNNALRKNRRILADLNTAEDGKSKVHRDKLVAKGFNFEYHTSIYTTQKGSVYIFCYEHGYLQLSDDFFMLVMRKEYLEK